MTDIFFSDIKARPDVFPLKWSCNKLGKFDVEDKTGGINTHSQLTTKSRLNSSYWKKKRLESLIESYNDDWHFNSQLIICVWNDNQKESDPPLGFISFSFSWEESKAKKIRDLILYIQLVWVRPDKRGLGGVVARHIVSHLLFYLEECKLQKSFISPRGVDVTYSAELYSLGGEEISHIIYEHLEVMKEIDVWKIRELEFNACL